MNDIDEPKLDSENSFSEQNNDTEKKIRCHWCNKEELVELNLIKVDYIFRNENQSFFCCSDDHSRKSLKFYHFIEKWGLGLYFFLFIFPLGFLITASILGIFFANFIFISFGLGLIIYPILGQKTINSLGLKNSIILTRILGIILIAIGVVLIVIYGSPIFN